ncbi:hypothetical protein OSB04_020000 [Centaurea solstitialis]|uniref:Integrase catalytic domain-containing protein n=1 Tax=Centaurea solstitialis TaxID=347529 RepID=A0AA38W5H7_9ASTR|nr:hypothetical protein OSB04_020000 [Centaurea solstitialis]
MGEPKMDVAKVHEDILVSLEPKPAAAAELMDSDWIDELGDLSCPECGSKDICAHSMDIDQLDIGSPNAPGIFMIDCLITCYESCVLDTGSGNHICNHLQGLKRRETLRKDRSNLRVGEDTILVAESIGSYSLSLPLGLLLELENCYYVPRMIKNIISFDLLVDHGFYYKYDYKLISCFKNDIFYFKETPTNGLYVLNLQESNKEVYHIRSDLPLALSARTYKQETHRTTPERRTSWSFNKDNERANELLGIIHTDVCGPFSHEARGGYRYFITFTDDFSRYGYNEVQNKLDKKIKFLWSDRGGEYLSQKFDKHLMECGIVSQLTLPYTPQMNGVSERRNRTLLDMVRSMMCRSTLPVSFWRHALEMAAHILNRVPTKSVEKTPYEIWTGKKTKFSFLKIWGCEVYVKRVTSEKLKPKSDKCIFLGYPKTTVGYYFYNPTENKVFVAQNGEFLEDKFLNLENTRNNPVTQQEHVETQLEIVEEVQTHDLRRSTRIRKTHDLRRSTISSSFPSFDLYSVFLFKMANTANAFMSTGSQSKPPTLVKEEYPQWKVRMVSFLEGIHPRICEFLYNPPYLPMNLIPRVPATETTPEIPEHLEPKEVINWSEEDKVMVDLGHRCKRLLIMAIPHDIFKSVDHCYLSKDIWAELERQIEGGRKTLKNNTTVCINEHHTFKALEGESLSDTYSRFNTLISNCKRYGIVRLTTLFSLEAEDHNGYTSLCL